MRHDRGLHDSRRRSAHEVMPCPYGCFVDLLGIAVVALLVIAACNQLAPKVGVASPLILLGLGIAVGFLPVVGTVEVEPEIVLEVDDVRAERDRVAVLWPLEEDLLERPWGLTDFRVVDPAGYYVRLTSREP